MKKLIVASLVLIITLPIGLFLLFGIVTIRIPYIGIFSEVRRTKGTVVAINHWTESGTAYQSPQVQFFTEEGQEISIDMVCAPLLDCFADYEVGSKVPVIYPKNYPEGALADTFIGLVWTPFWMILLGIAFSLAGPVYLYFVISDIKERSSLFTRPSNIDRAA